MPTYLDCNIPYTLVFPDVDIKGKTALIQLPDGMKQFSLQITKCVKERFSIDSIISIENTYGACDLQYNQIFKIIKPDLIMHIGHSPYPEYLASKSVNPDNRNWQIIYVKALSKLQLTEEIIDKASELLKEKSLRTISIALTSQHTHLYSFLYNELEKRGFKVKKSNGFQPYYEPGQILGCDFRASIFRDSEGYVFLGGGEFHPLGLYLATLKPVIQIDLYSNRVVDFTPIGYKYYKQRLFKVSQAMDANHWGIIIGLKTGQYRPYIINIIIKMLKGKDYVLLLAENINELSLRSIDNDWFDAFAITSCPRIPIDDLLYYDKPILTPGEAYMALNKKLDRYLFPW
ncbi:MAG: diphthamide biosynthesis enzyme Dph2 [Caldisphaera sp.]|jgi:2-(3-amino-3-carboxypropyl)histidine synthase|nr:diphthamide biosynthesis enzyme Dph2 [Caldisphaera sp.]PMP61170.1 MAG: diphthamide biosynthesis enzyme Dph2 [Caldisphaera sp.]PMP90841.1 MAG: diphthamide biosynthesis enzyme Dph2 [Caldisphaera sp.]